MGGHPQSHSCGFQIFSRFGESFSSFPSPAAHMRVVRKGTARLFTKAAGSHRESGPIAWPPPLQAAADPADTPRVPHGSSPAMTTSDARTWPAELGFSPGRLVAVPMRGGEREGRFTREDDEVLIIQPVRLIAWCHGAFSSTGKKHLRCHLYQPRAPRGWGAGSRAGPQGSKCPSACGRTAARPSRRLPRSRLPGRGRGACPLFSSFGEVGRTHHSRHPPHPHHPRRAAPAGPAPSRSTRKPRPHAAINIQIH